MVQDIEQQKKLNAMTARIHAAESKQEEGEYSRPPAPMKMSRIGFDFVGGILGCAFIGWLGDSILHTKPWALIILLVLGFIAGIINIWRALSIPSHLQEEEEVQ